MKRQAPTLDDIRSRVAANPALAALNPHLSGPVANPGSPPAAFSEKKAVGKLRGKMNATEAEFSKILDRRAHDGIIESWHYEGATLRWGALDSIKYTPDFTVFEQIEPSPECSIPLVRICFIEVKGPHIWPKDIQKFKAARNQWPQFGFELWQRGRGGAWSQLY